MPVVDAIASDYADEVTFVAVAGRASLEATAPVAEQLMPSGNMLWGLDESVWETFGVFGQPVTFVISADDVIVSSWSGLRNAEDIRQTLDQFAGTAG